MRAYRWLLFKLGRYRWFSWLIASVLTPIEKALYRVTGGRVTVIQVGRHRAVPELLLVTRGARTGAERRTPVLYVEDGGRLLVVGSNFGRERHPAWTANLRAHPEAEVVLHGESAASPRDARGRRGLLAAVARDARGLAGVGGLPHADRRDFRAFFLERA